MILQELCKFEDNYITVKLEGKEYVIDSISHAQDYNEAPSSHICLNIRDGGDGYIRR